MPNLFLTRLVILSILKRCLIREFERVALRTLKRKIKLDDFYETNSMIKEREGRLNMIVLVPCLTLFWMMMLQRCY